MRIEVAFGTADRQTLLELEVPAGTTIADAVRISGLEARYPDINFSDLEKGIWNRVYPDSREVREGDRVEIYRPLVTDPKTARRQRAGR